MPTRARVRDEDGTVYTLLQPTLPKRGKVKVRDQSGFPKEIEAKKLSLLKPDEPGAVMRYGEEA